MRKEALSNPTVCLYHVQGTNTNMGTGMVFILSKEQKELKMDEFSTKIQ